MSEMVKKALPHSPEAEKSVIACMLYDADAVGTAVSSLETEDFYDFSNQKLFQAMADLYHAARPVDVINVQEELKKFDLDPEIYSLEYLKKILATVFTVVNIGSYCKIVKDKAKERKFIRTFESLQEKFYAEKEDTEALVAETEKNIFELIENSEAKQEGNIENSVMNVLRAAETAALHPELIQTVKSGFYDLDNLTNGFKKTDLILIAARPSMGKTALALNMAENMFNHQNKKIMIFSLEMSEEQLTRRLLSMMTGIASQKIEKGQLSDSDWDNLVSASALLRNDKIKIVDKGAITVSEIRTKCRKQKLEKGLDVVLIDYLQLIGSAGRSENRQIEISEISRSLKALAKELDVPVIALSQLSRAPEARADHRPMLADLRESGAIEQDADMVMFIYRDEVYNPASPDRGKAELILSKHRNGPIGTVRVGWHAPSTRFINIYEKM